MRNGSYTSSMVSLLSETAVAKVVSPTGPPLNLSTMVDIILLSTISYGAGLIGYFIGKTFYDTRIYEFLQDRLLGKYETFLRKFGGFLIIVAALTPLPFSGICILVGSVKFNYKKFMLFSSFRFLRFFAYGYIVWQANLL